MYHIGRIVLVVRFQVYDSENKIPGLSLCDYDSERMILGL